MRKWVGQGGQYSNENQGTEMTGSSFSLLNIPIEIQKRTAYKCKITYPYLKIRYCRNLYVH